VQMPTENGQWVSLESRMLQDADVVLGLKTLESQIPMFGSPTFRQNHTVA
jgi:hypothetical protein